jgi:hypothetical protein
MSPDLDLACAKAADGVRVSEKVEDMTTAAAAVLAQNGPYACFLYLWAQIEKPQVRDAAVAIHTAAYGLLQVEFALPALTAPQEIQGQLEALSADLEKLLLAKSLLERLFMYLRYHAKAKRGAHR